MLTSFAAKLSAVLADRKGVTSIEYGVVAAALIIAVTAAIGTLNSSLSTAFAALGAAISAAF